MSWLAAENAGLLEALRASERARAVPAQEAAFVQLVVAASSNSQLLRDSALAAPTLSFSSLWADSVLRQRAASGGQQPHLLYAERAYSAALAASASLPDLQLLPVATAWHQRLVAGTAQASVQLVHPGEWRDYVLQVLRHACTATHPPPTALATWAREVAAATLESQRSPQLAVEVLTAILLRKENIGRPTRELIEQALWRPERQHVVLVGVHGARELPGIEAIPAGATLRQVRVGTPGQYRGWGHAGAKAAALTAGLTKVQVETAEDRYRSLAAHALLSVEVEAPDTNAAYLRARAAVRHAMDQYLAGHPTARLDLDFIGAAADPQEAGSFRVLDVRGAPVDSLLPLIVLWPPRLVTAMGMATLMRGSQGPMTKAALSWVVLESSGVKPNDDHRQWIAKALALHRVRQTQFRAYRALVAGVGANSDEQSRHSRRADVLRKRSSRQLRDAASAPASTALPLRLRSARSQVQALLLERLASSWGAEAARRQSLLAALGVGRSGSTFGQPGFAQLDDFDRWARLLTGTPKAGEQLGAAALTELRGFAPTLTEDALEAAAAMARGGPAMLEELQSQVNWMEAAVAGLYTCRNLHLHVGVRHVPGAVSMSSLGSAVADATFEIWSGWYTTISTPDPVTILQTLSQRFDDFQAFLTAGLPLARLDVGELTGPGWAPT